MAELSNEKHGQESERERSEERLLTRFKKWIYAGSLESVWEAQALAEPEETRVEMAQAWLSAFPQEESGWHLNEAARARAVGRLLTLFSHPGMPSAAARLRAEGALESFLGPRRSEWALDSGLGYLTRLAEKQIGDGGMGSRGAEAFLTAALRELRGKESQAAMACRALIEARGQWEEATRSALAEDPEGPSEKLLALGCESLGRLKGSSSARAKGAFKALGSLAWHRPSELKRWLDGGAPFTEDAARGAFVSLARTGAGAGVDERIKEILANELLARLKGAGVWGAGFASAVASDPRLGGAERAVLEKEALSETTPAGGSPARAARI